MADPGQVLVLDMENNCVVVSVGGVKPDRFDPELGFRIPVEFDKISSVSGHTMLSTIKVGFIDQVQRFPSGFVEGKVPQGPKEYFATVANLRHSKEGPLTAGVHIALEEKGPKCFSFILGGGEIQVKFPLKKFMRLETRVHGRDEAEISFTLDPRAIDFPSNKCVTDWEYISSMFREVHVTEGASIDFKNIMTRLRLRANLKKDGSTAPALLLEALVIPQADGTWDGISDTKKCILGGNGSAAIELWNHDVTWYSPLSKYKLETVMGFSRSSIEVGFPVEILYRWFLQSILSISDRGRSQESHEEYISYWSNPVFYDQTLNGTFWLPYPFSGAPNATHLPPVDKGMFSSNEFSHFVRNGKLIKRPKVSTKPNKYNPVCKSNMSLIDILPPDAPPRLKPLASRFFNASIADSSAKSYNTACNHVHKLEDEIGRKFSWPLSEKDSNLIMMYLLEKGIQQKTVKTYLSGIRRMAFAKGVSNPDQTSSLGKVILQGYQNLNRNPIVAVKKNTHRPITIPFLRLLGHVIATRWKGAPDDKQTFWTICLIAFWGSFRIGELLSETKAFSPGSDMLGTDLLSLTPNSFALWVRDPKIPKEFGDVVELWSIDQFKDLDPVVAFHTHWNKRQSKGFSTNLPLFMREDGSPFTHSYFSSILKAMIKLLPTGIDKSENNWTGHSFRSGLPTMLQTAGFEDDEIKAWGRWSSSAFRLYTKDIGKRLAVQKSILSAMDKLKAIVQGSI